MAGEAGLPGAGLLGLALKLGARVFRGSEEDNIKLLGKWGLEKIIRSKTGKCHILNGLSCYDIRYD